MQSTRRASMGGLTKLLFNTGFVFFIFGVFADKQLHGFADILIGLGTVAVLSALVMMFINPPLYIADQSQFSILGFRVLIGGFLVSATAIGLNQFGLTVSIFNLMFKLGLALFVAGALWLVFESVRTR